MRMMVLVAGAMLIVGCSGKKYCEREQVYEQVENSPALRAPAGLSVPEPDPSYTIPEVSVNARAAALNADRPCLEIPPRLRSTTTVEEEG